MCAVGGGIPWQHYLVGGSLALRCYWGIPFSVSFTFPANLLSVISRLGQNGYGGAGFARTVSVAYLMVLYM